jgi:hypothetical protein
MGFLIGPSVGGILSLRGVTARQFMLICAGIACFGAVIVWFFVEESRQPQRDLGQVFFKGGWFQISIFGSLQYLWRRRVLYSAGIVFVISFTAMGHTSTWYFFATQAYGWTDSQVRAL